MDDDWAYPYDETETSRSISRVADRLPNGLVWVVDVFRQVNNHICIALESKSCTPKKGMLYANGWQIFGFSLWTIRVQGGPRFVLYLCGPNGASTWWLCLVFTNSFFFLIIFFGFIQSLWFEQWFWVQTCFFLCVYIQIYTHCTYTIYFGWFDLLAQNVFRIVIVVWWSLFLPTCDEQILGVFFVSSCIQSSLMIFSSSWSSPNASYLCCLNAWIHHFCLGGS